MIERLHEEFRRRVKTQGSLPTEDAALVLLFGLVASGQIRLRRARRVAPDPGGAARDAASRRHDASRIGARIAFDGPTHIRVSPEIASFWRSRSAAMLSHLEFDR